MMMIVIMMIITIIQLFIHYIIILIMIIHHTRGTPSSLSARGSQGAQGYRCLTFLRVILRFFETCLDWERLCVCFFELSIFSRPGTLGAKDNTPQPPQQVPRPAGVRHFCERNSLLPIRSRQPGTLGAKDYTLETARAFLFVCPSLSGRGSRGQKITHCPERLHHYKLQFSIYITIQNKQWAIYCTPTPMIIEIMLENTTEDPLDKSSEHPLGKWQSSLTNTTEQVNIRWNRRWDPRWFLRCRFLVCNISLIMIMTHVYYRE